MFLHTRQRGFTLIEMVMVIVILGVIGGMVSVFMKGPIDAYFASSRRAALTDVADTTVRRMARDIHKSLPNSLRTPGVLSQCVEFIPTKTGGRYRAQELVAGDGKSLDFSVIDTTFNMLGSNTALPVNQQILAGDAMVIYNLGIPGADAYNQDNTATISSLGTPTAAPVETPIVLNPGKKFPLTSGSNRFQVISATEQVVGYVCDSGKLRRYVKTLPYAAPATCPSPAVSDPIIATNVSSCSFDYTGSDLQRNSLIRMTLQITDSGETVSLQHEVHMNNTP